MLLSYSASGQDSSYYSPEARIRFADHLYCSGDFFRAGLEYHEAFINRGDSLSLLKWIFAQWRSDNLSDITQSVEQLSGNSQKSIGSALLFGLQSSRFDSKLPPPELGVRIESLASYSGHPSVNLINDINYYIHGTYPEIPSGLPEEAKQELILLKNNYQTAGYKSPVLAGVLSALIPGSGKIYTGDTGDGVTGFILTSLFGYLAFTSFDHDHQTRGYILGAAAAGFYLGNIYGSYISAHLQNEKTQFDLKSDFGNFIIKNNWFLGFRLELPCDP